MAESKIPNTYQMTYFDKLIIVVGTKVVTGTADAGWLYLFYASDLVAMGINPLQKFPFIGVTNGDYGAYSGDMYAVAIDSYGNILLKVPKGTTGGKRVNYFVVANR